MFNFAKVIDEKTKRCDVGIGTNRAFYRSIGMTEQEVEQAYNGAWYLKGYAPEKPDEVKAQEVRATRDAYLSATDKYMIPDFPISDEERERYKAYRQYLRNMPEDVDFPNYGVMTFEEWQTMEPAEEPAEETTEEEQTDDSLTVLEEINGVPVVYESKEEVADE